VNTAHDLGGMHGFGKVQETDPTASLFHAQWEKRVLAITLAMGATGSWNIDQSRSARENVPPAQYLSSSYFEIWFEGLKKLLLDRDLVTLAEIQSGRLITPAKKLHRQLLANDVAATLAKGSPCDRPSNTLAKFSMGQAVNTRNLHPSAHTRLPRYARGRVGHIEAIRGFHVFPDANAQAIDEAQWLYTVKFLASELWGSHTSASAVYIDCWESYLDERK
jgi:nitrile hydratase subunit beta